MEKFWLEVLAEIVAAAIIAVIPLIMLWIRVSRRQRELATFFGLSSAARQVQIKLSRYVPAKTEEILPGGAFSTGWTSETVSIDEFQGAQAISNLFRRAWALPSLSSILDGLTGNERGYGRVEVHIDPVDPDPSWSTPGTLVVMGTGAKESNLLASRFLGEPADPDYSVYTFIKDPDKGRAFERLQVRGYAPQSFFAADWSNDEHQHELALLQRVTLSDGKVVFLCAGKDSPGTMMVARYLADNWRDLLVRHRDRKQGDFANLYVFSHDSPSAPRLLDSVV